MVDDQLVYICFGVRWSQAEISLLYLGDNAENFLVSSLTAEMNFNLSFLILKWALHWALLGFNTMITSDKNSFQDCCYERALEGES